MLVFFVFLLIQILVSCSISEECHNVTDSDDGNIIGDRLNMTLQQSQVFLRKNRIKLVVCTVRIDCLPIDDSSVDRKLRESLIRLWEKLVGTRIEVYKSMHSLLIEFVEFMT